MDGRSIENGFSWYSTSRIISLIFPEISLSILELTVCAGRLACLPGLFVSLLEEVTVFVGLLQTY